MNRSQMFVCIVATATLGAPAMPALAHSRKCQMDVRPLASNIIIPQRRAFSTQATPSSVQITGVSAHVVILEQVATTTLDIHLHNPAGSRQEAELIVPVPNGAVVRGFTFQGSSDKPTAQTLPKDEARRLYDEIVAKVRDPALLEFIDYNLIRSSVFPVDAHGKQRVRLIYEHLLPAEAQRVDYFLPRTEAIDYTVPWQVSVDINSKQPISTVYSPSHALDTRRISSNKITVEIAPSAVGEPGSFRISYLLERNGMTASMFAYPDESVGGGYFLLLAGLPADPQSGSVEPAIKREVTLVLDRSGSMNGEKLEQVQEAALQIMAGLEDGEAFNVIVYNEVVERFAPRPVLKDDATIKAARRYLKGVKARGGTNIHDALLESLRQEPTDDMLPLVLFLTDGLPTIGQTSEKAIRALATDQNPHRRRVFTFGVGVDVNSPLLENLAYESRATATFVLPSEDVERHLHGVFKHLQGPIVAEPTVKVLDANNQAALGRVRDLMPARLPDLYEGDQLVLLGQYVGDQPVTFELSGNYLGRVRSFRFGFEFDKATTHNAFVPRLWASRKIGILIDAIRSSGADNTLANQMNDPKIKELVDEIVRLSTEFGILTEYTAFLAREGTDLTNPERVLELTRGNMGRAVRLRTGLAGINQDNNQMFIKGQRQTNIRNSYFNDKMERVSISRVQQVNDRAFFNRAGSWVDSRLVGEKNLQPKQVIEFGSPEYLSLARRLAGEGRQGSIALSGDVMLQVDGDPVLIKAP